MRNNSLLSVPQGLASKQLPNKRTPFTDLMVRSPSRAVYKEQPTCFCRFIGRECTCHISEHFVDLSPPQEEQQQQQQATNNSAPSKSNASTSTLHERASLAMYKPA
eukprot:474565-Amphidinium_carterae.1